MPLPFTANQIKAWFETGDKPTQQQFADMVDTFFYLIQESEAKAQSALDTVEGFVTSNGVAKVICRVRTHASVAINSNIDRDYGCTVNIIESPSTSTHWRVTLTYDVAYANTTYVVYSVIGGILSSISSKNAGSLVVDIQKGSTFEIITWP